MFEVGTLYSREAVAELIGMPVERRKGPWLTGYDEWNGQAFIFANVGIAGRTGHNYPNMWAGKNLIWWGRTGSSRGQPQIDRLISNESDVHIFWRADDRSDFTYAGPGEAVAASDGMPVQVIWSFEGKKALSGRGDAFAESPVWRRGPPPITGEISYARGDGETDVYLLRLIGPVDALLDVAPGFAVIKIGMSRDVHRRIRELNAGFPPGSRVAWSLAQVRRFANGTEAWKVEGKHLEAMRKGGVWIGGEFGLVSEEDLPDLNEGTE